MCFDHDGYAELYNETPRKARKEHKCYSCCQSILVGEQHLDIFGKYEGDAEAVA